MRPIAFLPLLASLGLCACGTPNFGSVQTVRVDTQPSAAASCTLSNAEGQWTIARTPGKAAVAKSPSNLAVTCETPDGRRGTGMVPPQALKPFTGSARVASFFGAEVDPKSGQSHRYPPYLRVVLSESALRGSAAASSRLALSPMLAERITGGAGSRRRTASVTSTRPSSPASQEPMAQPQDVRLQSPEPGRKPSRTAAEEDAEAARILSAIGADRNDAAAPPPAAPLDLTPDAPEPRAPGPPPTLMEEGEAGSTPEGLVQPLPPKQESRLRGRSARDAAGLPPLAPLQPSEPVELAPAAPPVSEPTTDVLPRCAFGDIVVPAERDTCLRSGGELLD